MGLKWSELNQPTVIARDRKKGKILLGGLGVMGVGQRWYIDKEHHKIYVGYEDAPEKEWNESCFGGND